MSDDVELPQLWNYVTAGLIYGTPLVHSAVKDPLCLAMLTREMPRFYGLHYTVSISIDRKAAEIFLCTVCALHLSLQSI